MHYADLGQIGLHYSDMGDKEAPVLSLQIRSERIFVLWDPILPFLPNGLRIVRYDKRGHGLSQCPAPPYSMGALVHDAERLFWII